MLEGQESVGSRIPIKKGFRNLAVEAGRTWETWLEEAFAWLANCFHLGCLGGFGILMEMLMVLKTPKIPLALHQLISTLPPDKLY